jgi:response regulator RpfG family c-di-GMP phosphodiesterase
LAVVGADAACDRLAIGCSKSNVNASRGNSQIQEVDSMNDEVISVLVVDDHKMVRQGICALLEIEPKVMVVGQAANADEAVRLASQLCPDVVLLDYSLPGIEGDQVIRQLRSD